MRMLSVSGEVMRPLITGATGTLGRALLAKHKEAVVLSRDPSRVHGLDLSVESRAWRPEAEEAPREAFAEVDAVFHLAGEPVAEGRRLGNGTQWMPWVHIDDVIGLLLHAARHAEISGPMNAVSPHPVRNSEFTHELAALLHRPALLAVPKAALRVAFGEVSDVLLASQWVLPRRAGESGYSFQFRDLSSALAAAMNTPSSNAPA